MSRSEESLQEDCRDRDVSFSNTHFDLKFIDDLISDRYNLLKHTDLFFITNDDDFDVTQEIVSRVATIDIEVNLGSNFLEEDEVAL